MSDPNTTASDDDTSALVSVVIPAYRAAHVIGGCLDSVLAQTWPVEHTEVIVVDGCSDDGTAGIARDLLERRGFVRVVTVENPGRTIPSNLNRGLAEAHGEFVCRVDVRSRLPEHYVATCVATLTTHPGRKVVGGRQYAVPPTPDAKGRGIARGLNNRLTMGLSRYRRGAGSGPSDTVYLGFYRTEELRIVGGWDERLLVNEDFDLNQRFGGVDTVWFDNRLDVGYVPRSGFAELFSQYLGFGKGKVDYWRLRRTSPKARQWLAMIAPPAAAMLAAVPILGASRGRRACRVVSLLTVASIVALTVEHAGTTAPARPEVRLMSLLTTVTTTTAWTVGSWLRLASRGNRHRATDRGTPDMTRR